MWRRAGVNQHTIIRARGVLPPAAATPRRTRRRRARARVNHAAPAPQIKVVAVAIRGTPMAARFDLLFGILITACAVLVRRAVPIRSRFRAASAPLLRAGGEPAGRAAAISSC